MVGYYGRVPRFLLVVRFQGWIQKVGPNSVFQGWIQKEVPIVSSQVGSKYLVPRLSPTNGTKVGSQFWVTCLGHKVGFKGYVPRFSILF